MFFHKYNNFYQISSMWNKKIIQKLEETKYTDSNLVEVKKNKDQNQKNYSEIVDNVQSEYIKNNDTMAGSIIAQDDYYGKNDHTNQLEYARWLLKKFDGIVYLVTESDQKNTKSPDFIWDGRLWDLKTPVGYGKRTIDNQFKKIHKQIGNNPGGIIIDCSFTDLEAVSKRMMLCKLEGDVIIRKKDFVISILRKRQNGPPHYFWAGHSICTSIIVYIKYER